MISAAHCVSRVRTALVAGACLAAGLAMAQPTPPAAAADLEVDDARPAAPAWRWEATSVARLRSPAVDDHAAAQAGAMAVDYRLWYGDRRTELGLGLGATPGLSLAVRHQISSRSHVTLDTRFDSGGGFATDRTQRHPLSLGFESTAMPAWARGHLLRARLNAHSSLALRLRGGRVGLYLQMKIAGQD